HNHLVIGLMAISVGIVVLIGMFGSHRMRGWTAFFLLTTILTRYWFPVSNSRFYLGARHRACVMRAVGAGALWPLPILSRRCLALDLRCLRFQCAVPQRAGADCSVVPETAGTQTTGANPVRAVVPDSEGRCTNRFSFYQHCCGAQISPRPGFFHLVD